MPPTLQIPRLFADAFYLLAHDDVTGRPRQALRLTHLSMGASVLAELIFTEQVYIDAVGVVVFPSAGPMNVVQMTVVEEIAAERKRRRAGEWIRHLGPIVTPLIAARLERAGYHRAVPVPRIRLVGRYFITTAPRWQPDTSAYTSATMAHLNNGLDKGYDLHPQELALVALVYATGLNRQVFPYVRDAAVSRVLAQARYLGGGLPQLFDDTSKAAASAVAAATH